MNYTLFLAIAWRGIKMFCTRSVTDTLNFLKIWQYLGDDFCRETAYLSLQCIDQALDKHFQYINWSLRAANISSNRKDRNTQLAHASNHPDFHELVNMREYVLTLVPKGAI